MGNTPSNQASPARGAASSNNVAADKSNPSAASSRHPNLRLPMPQRPTHISPVSSNPTSPSGRGGSPRRRKSLELPDLNKLSFTPAAPVPTLATNTSHHLATPSNKRNTSNPPSTQPSATGRWKQALGGRVASPLAGNALGAMSRIDGPVSAPKTAPVAMPGASSTKTTDEVNPYFPSSPDKSPNRRMSPKRVLPIKIPGTSSPARKPEPPTEPSSLPTGTAPPPPTTAPTPPSRVSREQLDDGLVAVPIQWNGGGKTVFVTGNFADNWKGRIKLSKSQVRVKAIADDSTHDFNTVLRLPPGQYRLKFIVDDSWRCSKQISTATDDDGTLVNWIEVEAPKTEDELKAEWATDAKSPVTTDDDDALWTSVIPAPLVLYQYLEELPMTCAPSEYDEHVSRFPHMTAVPQPPTLPRILDKVILNSEPRRNYDDPMPNALDDNSILPVPNHVVLNHLTASAIKNGTLGVGTTTRYRKKYITTMFFKPTLGDLMDGAPAAPGAAGPPSDTSDSTKV